MYYYCGYIYSHDGSDIRENPDCEPYGLGQDDFDDQEDEEEETILINPHKNIDKKK